MKKNVIPLVAAAMALTFTACQPTDKVDPAVTATDTNPDQLLRSTSAFIGAPGNASTSGNLSNAKARTGQPSPAQIKAAFDAFDGDKSGQISATELADAFLSEKADLLDFLGFDKEAIKLLKKLSKEARGKDFETEFIRLIKMFDANNSGMWEFNEFERLIEEVLKHGK